MSHISLSIYLMTTPRSVLFFSYYIQCCSEHWNRHISLTYWFLIPLDMCPEVVLLDHVLILFSVFHTVFCNYRINLHFHHQHIRIPCSPLSCQFIKVILTDMIINSLWLNFCFLNDLVWTVPYTWYTLVFFIESFVCQLLN